MSVREELQGQGVGTALMNELMTRAASRRVADDWYGLVRVELEVYTDNEPALELYRGCGFEIEGTLRAGEYVDAYVMSRIRPAATRPTLPLK